MTQFCSHFEPEPQVGPPLNVCETCIKIGGKWVHLRQCLTCGLTLCCDNSPGRHATAHHRETGHPMIRSAEVGEDWLWCYNDDLLYLPGPAGYQVSED